VNECLGRKERETLIQDLEKKRQSKIITYVTLTDRPNVPVLQIADDAVRPIHDQLEQVGMCSKIDLFIYTRGGGTIAAYRIAKLLREYCKEFNVLVPFRAHSAGTLLAFGANNIIMSRLGELSPVDPSTVSMFNPVLRSPPQGDPADPRNRIPISVEDVTSYLDLSREKVGLVSENDKLEVFRILANKIEPLALGNVNRVYDEIRTTTKRLLALHIDPKTEEDKLQGIVKAFTEEYTHEYLITRDIAREAGLNILNPDQQEENLMMNLWKDYETELKMYEPLDPEAILAQAQPPNTPVNIKLRLGFIETALGGFTFEILGLVHPRLQQMSPLQPPPVIFKIGKWLNINQAAGPYV